MEKIEGAFWLIVISRPYQSTHFSEEDERMKYTVIVTNRTESAEDVVTWYN